jgi:hypothetical protein
VKFWNTIAKMCGVRVDASQWGERSIRRTASAQAGGFAGAYERVDELVGNVRGHALKIEMRDHSLTATINGHGFRIVETEKAVAINSHIRIGLIAIERIRPMVGKSGSTGDCAAAMTDFARKASRYGNAVDKPS